MPRIEFIHPTAEPEAILLKIDDTLFDPRKPEDQVSVARALASRDAAKEAADKKQAESFIQVIAQLPQEHAAHVLLTPDLVGELTCRRGQGQQERQASVIGLIEKNLTPEQQAAVLACWLTIHSLTDGKSGTNLVVDIVEKIEGVLKPEQRVAILPCLIYSSCWDRPLADRVITLIEKSHPAQITTILVDDIAGQLACTGHAARGISIIEKLPVEDQAKVLRAPYVTDSYIWNGEQDAVNRIRARVEQADAAAKAEKSPVRRFQRFISKYIP